MNSQSVYADGCKLTGGAQKIVGLLWVLVALNTIQVAICVVRMFQ